MILSSLEINLPLANPVLIFSIILFIILFAPIVLNKFKIPPLIGLILAGAIVGPLGIGLLERNSSIILFGTVGLLYIMFLAGLEIDLNEFKKNSKKSLIFGMYTFSIPMIFGVTTGYYLFNYSLPTSFLVGSMLASHTLIAYPIISKLGVAKNRAVSITIGGTLITDTLALLVVAVIAGMAGGNIHNEFWLRLSVSIIIFGLIVMLVFPFITRWFFKRFNDNISQYIFVLGMVFFAAFLAEAAGLKALIGAFLAGLALNRLIPHTSPLMNRIEFVGSALFIPFFLIGVGMLIDIRIFFQNLDTIYVAAVLIIIATLSKFIPAWLTQKTFNLSADERRVIFGLSNARVAATLAIVTIGYNIITGETPTGEPVRLLNESILNGTILMILVTCTISSFVTQKGAQNIALDVAPGGGQAGIEERILIPVKNINTVEELINLSVTVKSKKNKTGLYALTVIENNSEDIELEKKSQLILNKASKASAATDNFVHELLRYDVNITNGIVNVIRENKITDLILGLHEKSNIADSFLGTITDGILEKSDVNTLIYRPVQPLGTLKRHIIVVPDKAEREIGFPFWLIKIWNIAGNTGAGLLFYAPEHTLNYIKAINQKHPVACEFKNLESARNVRTLLKNVNLNDNIIIIMSRKGKRSYHRYMKKTTIYLNKYFSRNSQMIIYPMQTDMSDSNYNFNNSAVKALKDNLDKFDEIGKTISRLLKKI